MGNNGFLGNTKAGYYHQLSDKSQLAFSVANNLEDPNAKTKMELGLNGKCTDKFASRVKVLRLFRWTTLENSV
jgi:hypothetical protein